MRPVLLVLALLAALLPVSLPFSAALASPARAEDRAVTLTRWQSAAELRAGARSGLRVRRGALVLDAPARQRVYKGVTYDVGTWTGPATSPVGGFTSLVASWSATTPGDSWIEVRVQASDATRTGRWMVLGRWASADAHVRRTSVAGQDDPLGHVATDTWQAAAPAGATSYVVQVRLMRRAGATTATPTLSSVSAMTSRLPAGVPPVSAPGPASGPGMGTVLDVPTYSQMIHRGQHPEYGGGGEAWCAPTSVAMVLGYYGRLPGTGATHWAGTGPDPWVAESARRSYDVAYEGTGNWSFGTAYAASRGLDAFVTRLRSLREVEDLVAAGIPVVVSVSFAPGRLTGAPISSTDGHLMVVVGFTATGDVVVNDPAGPTDTEVRHTYDRAQLEAAWLAGSGGTAYVVHDTAHPLPPSTGNW